MRPFFLKGLSVICLFLITSNAFSNILVNIQKGQSASLVCQQLKQKHLVQYVGFCKVFFRLSSHGNHIKAGLYEFNSSTSLFDIYDALIQGQEKSFKWVINERSSPAEVISTLLHHPYISTDGEIILQNQTMINDLQGKLYPDTYFFKAYEKSFVIIDKAYSKMQNVLSDEWSKRDLSLDIHNADEALIIASLIEMETSHLEEKALISSVIHNRLKINMPLQIDAAVQFGLGKKSPINLDDLKVKTPYNTYLMKGLPPKPICFPGRESIHAALHPAKTKYIYYVLGKNSKHVFSKNYQVHLNNIKGN